MRERHRTLICTIVLAVVAGLSASFTGAASGDTAVTDPCAIQQTKPGFSEVVTACIVPVGQHGYSELRWSITGGSSFIRSFVMTSPFPGYSEIPNIIPIPGCTPNLGTTSGLDLGHLYGYTCPASPGQGVVGPFPYGTNQPVPYPAGSITFLGTDCEINPGPHCEPTFDHIQVSGTYTIYAGGTPPTTTGCTSPTLAILDDRTNTVVSGRDVKAAVGEDPRLAAIMTCLDSGNTEPASGITWTLSGNPVGGYVVSNSFADPPWPYPDTFLHDHLIDPIWIHSGSYTVSVTADGASAPVTATVVVSAPTFKVTTQQCPLGLRTTYVPLTRIVSSLNFSAGQTDGCPGSGFTANWTVQPPASGTSGNVNIFQLRSDVVTHNGTSCLDHPGLGLDVSEPYANTPDVALDGTTVSFHSDDTQTISLYDPEHGLTKPFTGVTAREFHASTYLMYRPAGVHSIWVALGKLDWGFKGSVTYVGNVGGHSLHVLIPVASVKASNFKTVLSSPVDEPTWTSAVPSLTMHC